MKIIRAILVLNALLAMLALRGYTQTVSPVVVQCGKKCNGEFTVTNNGVQPFAVTVDAYSFSLDNDGKSLLRPLDASADVQLDSNSARVGPMASHTFAYRMSCTHMPCMVTLYSAMVVGHTADGLAMRVLLPHVIYQCDRAKNCRADVRKAAGLKQ